MARRHAHKVDASQEAAVKALRELYTVTILSMVGNGVPDLLVTGYRYKIHDTAHLLVEWKNSEKDRLTPAELQYALDIPGAYMVAWDIQQVIDWFEETL